MQHLDKITFPDFLERFPVVALPIILGDETHHTFSQQNQPLPAAMVEKFIIPQEKVQVDEFTEYIACFRIPETHDIYAIVWWRAGLMDYQYILTTYSKKGEQIDQRVIAGTFSDGKTITRSVATIDHDWIIHVVTGQTDARGEMFDPTESKATELEMLADGFIVDSM